MSQDKSDSKELKVFFMFQPVEKVHEPLPGRVIAIYSIITLAKGIHELDCIRKIHIVKGSETAFQGLFQLFYFQASVYGTPRVVPALADSLVLEKGDIGYVWLQRLGGPVIVKLEGI